MSSRFGELRPSNATFVPSKDSPTENEVRADRASSWPEDIREYCSTAFDIPGMGEAGPRCQDWVPTEFCDGAIRDGDGSATHIHLTQHLCGRRECPHCWLEWSRQRTVKGVQRLAAARQAGENPIDKRAVHVTISPPEGSVVTVQEFYDARTKAVEIAREHGVRGGAIIAHPFRATEETKDRWKEVRDDFDGGIWKWIRENDTPWREQVYWSPHFHVVGLSRDVEAGDRDDGWLVKNIERGGSHGLAPFRLTETEGYEDMAGLFRYLLSHAGFDTTGETTRQCMTWFGSLHGTNFDPEEVLSPGTWDTIQRYAEEVVGTEAEEPGTGGEPGEACPIDGCDGELHEIFGVPAYIDRYRDQIPSEARERLRAAFEWRMGDRPPPDGLKHPQTEEQAREVIQHLSET